MQSPVIVCGAGMFDPAIGSVTARYPRRALAAVTAAAGVVFVDGAVVVLGLPGVQREFGLQGAQLQWALNAYLLPLAALSVVAGAIGDRVGRRKALLLGLAAFGLGALSILVAASAAMFVAARFVQGLGAAFVIPNSMSAIGQLVSGEDETRAVGTWSVSAAIVSAVSPPLAGWFVERGQWRPVFLIALPLILAALIGTYCFVPCDEGRVDHEFDVGGGLLAGASLAIIVWQITSGISPTGVAVLAVCVSAFILVERKMGAAAALPLALIASRALGGISAFTLLLYASFNLFLLAVPFVLLQGLHQAGTVVGMIFIPLQLAFVAITPATGAVVRKVGVRATLASGALMCASGFVVSLRIPVEADYWIGVFPAVLLMATGMSLVAAPLTTLVLTAVDKAHIGVSAGINNAMTRIGAMASTALLGGMLTHAGDQLIKDFTTAALVGAAACIAAALSAAFVHAERVAP